MTQSHAQIKLTPKPINLDDVISFVSDEGLSTCSYSKASSRENTVSISPEGIEAQAIMAKMELDDIILFAYEEFNISKIAIHFRLGNCDPNDTVVAFAVSSTDPEESDSACQAISAKLNGTYENLDENAEIYNARIKSN